MPSSAAVSGLSGGASTSMMTRSTIFGAGVASSAGEMLSFLASETLKRRVSARVEAVFALFSLLQLLTFCLDPLYVSGSGLESAFSDLGLVRNPLAKELSAGRPFVLWPLLVGVGLVAVYLLVFGVQLFFVARGDTGFHRLYSFLRFGSLVWCRALLLPLLYLLLSPLSQDGAPAGLIALGIVFAVFHILICVHASLFTIAHFRPSSSIFASTLPRYAVLFTAMAFVLAISDAFVKPQPAWGPAAHSAVCCVLFVANTASALLFSPYMRKVISHIFAGSSLALLWASLCLALCLASVRNGWRLGWCIASLAGILPFGVLGFFASRLRMAHPNMRVPFFSPPSAKLAAKSDLPHAHTLAVDISVRSLWSAPGTAPQQALLSNASSVFEAALELFPESHHVRMCYALFLLDAAADIKRLKLFLNSMQMDTRPPLDVAIRFYCITKSISRHESLSADGESDLLVAERHHRMSRRALADFWEKLGQGSRHAAVDYNSLLHSVAALVEHERAADHIFRRLLLSHAKATLVMREYAEFLEEISDEREQAEILHQQADLLDERRKERLQQQQARPRERVVQLDVIDVDPVVRPSASRRVDLPGSVQQLQSEMAEESVGAASHSPSIASMASSIESSASAVTGEHLRRLELKARLAHRKSPHVQRAQLAVLVALAFFVVGMIATFSLAHNAMQTLEEAIFSVDGSATSSRSIVVSAFRLRQLMAHDFLGASYVEGRNVTLAQLDEVLEEMRYDHQLAFNHTQEGMLSVWEDATVPIVTYVRGDDPEDLQSGHFDLKNHTLRDSVLQLETHLKQAELFVGVTSSAQFATHPSWRFIVDNMETITTRLIGVCGSVSEHTGTLLRNAEIEVAVLFATFSAIGIAGLVVVVLRVFVRIEAERRTSIEIFKDIPRSTCTNIREKLVAKHASSAAQVNLSKELISRRVPVLQKIGAVLFVGILIVVLSMAAMLLTITLYTNQVDASDDVIMQEGRRQSAAMKMMFHANEVVIADDNFFSLAELRTAIHNEVELLEAADYTLKYTLGEAREEDAWLQLNFETPCPESLLHDWNVTCTGLEGMLVVYESSILEFSSANSSARLTWANLLHSQAIFESLDLWMIESLDFLYHEAIYILETSLTVFNLCFAAGIIVAAAMAFILVQMLQSVSIINSRAASLLLLAPMSVVSASDAISQFLEDGTISQMTIKQLSEEKEKKMQMLLEGSADGVLIVDNNGVVVMANPAAESILARKAEVVIGTQALSLLAERCRPLVSSGIAELQKEAKRGRTKAIKMEESSEVMIVRPDSKEVPVLVTLTSAVASDGVTVAMFIKDISCLRAHEAELQRERRRADLLLENILPPPVIETLKAHPGDTVAQKYESVTVLFADIVEFTPKAAGMEPTALVAMLNEIFSSWDELCVEHGIEKVKTIGDCFMAACGVPVACSDHAKRMVEFAVAALASLAEYNAEHPDQPQIQMRIGINTGSVVAGVIGKTKFQYDLWGDAVNTASRIESTGLPNRVHVSESTFAATRDFFEFESRGKIALKGKGEQETYLLKLQAAAPAPSRPASKFRRPRTEEVLFEIIADQQSPPSTAPKKSAR